MPAIPIIITKAGRAALVNAEHNGTAPLTVTHIGLSADVFTPDADMLDLPGEFKRLDTLSGEVVAADTIHVTIRDDGNETYTVRGIGYWLSNGVLLGIYGQPDPILQKSAQSMLLLSADTIFTTIDVTSLTFGNANFTNPPATITRQGVVELATHIETVDGIDHTRAVTPAGLTPALANAIDQHKDETDPHPGYLTDERGDALYFRTLDAVTDSDTDCDTLLTTGVRDVMVANDRGILEITHLPLGGDGFGTLVTLHGGQFVRQLYTEGGTTQRSWERTGFTGQAPTFKGRAWKLLWDTVTFDPDSKENTLGYTPVQQGTGIGQTQNPVKIGWSENEGLKVTVDVSDLGTLVLQSALNDALRYKVTGNADIRLQWDGRGGQPTWVHGGYDNPSDCALFNPATFNVNYANSTNYANSAGVATYAHQLVGAGLQENSIGSYRLNKNHSWPEVGGAWQLRGWAYDHGTGGDGGIGTRITLWQRVG